MKKSRKRMWGGAWFGLVADEPGVASGQNANATTEKPGLLDTLLGKKTPQQEMEENNKKIEELKEKNKAIVTSLNNTQGNPNGMGTATGTTTGETGTTTGETGTTTGETIGGGKRSRRRRGRKTKRSRRSRRHR